MRKLIYTIVGIATKKDKASKVEIGDCATQYIIDTSEENALSKSNLGEKSISNVEELGKDWQ